jgi:hypothetical protein
MRKKQSDVIASALEEMRFALNELAAGTALLTTSRAVELSPVPVSAEMLLSYPEWVMPRLSKNPRAKRPTYLIDPRDVRSLPRVLADWDAAIRAGDENTYIQRRMDLLRDRDLRTGEAA